MGFEVWIAIVFLASGLSGWIGYAYAKKNAPRQDDLDAMAAELEQARQQSESVQENVSEHFEQSAMLFGKLAADYREFLDHFESSAQNLGLSEARARELIEQGFQPLLTHEASEASEASVVAQTTAEAAGAVEESAPAETTLDADPDAGVEASEAGTDQRAAGVGDVTVELPDGERVESETERQRA